MCLVASGCVEVYYEIGTHVWDVAAGSLIVTEAGGVLMDVEGKGSWVGCCLMALLQVRSMSCPYVGGDVDLMSRKIVAANSRTIAERIIKEIAAFSPPRDDVLPQHP